MCFMTRAVVFVISLLDDDDEIGDFTYISVQILQDPYEKLEARRRVSNVRITELQSRKR